MNLKPEEAAKLAEDLLDLGTSTGDEPELVGVGSGPVSLPGGRLGNYRVTRLVGTGGMGEVYEAEQDNPRRRVALKVIRSHLLSPDVRRRFEHEVRILGSLHHPGIAQIYEAGHFPSQGLATPDGDEAPTSPFFAMEFVQGEPLTSYAASRKLSTRERLELFLRLCQAVEHAHQRGIIHRDLKPANILVTPPPEPGADSKPASSLSDRLGQPKVLDFGVARATDVDVSVTSLRTEIGKLVGTLPYMSPEQASGDAAELDTRSDVYALGVVLYELLSGKLPYDVRSGGGGGGAGVANALRVIKEADPAPLSTVDRVFRGDIETIVGKALEKERERRYQSVGELAADVRRYLADEPIVARRAGAWYQCRKLAKRNRGTAVLLLLLFGVLLTASALLARFAFLESRALKRESAQRTIAENARERAEGNYQKMLGVTQFLTEILRGADANVLPSEDATVLSAVDRAISSMGARFASEPEVESWIRDTAGSVYLSHGRLEDAEVQFRRSIELTRGRTGEASEPHWGAMSNLANTLERQGRAPEALELIEAALSGSATQPDQDEEGVLAMKAVKASILEKLGRTAEGLEVAREVLDRRRELLGDEHADTISSHTQLAKHFLRKGQAEQAELNARRAVEGAAAGSGLDDPVALDAANVLAVSLHQLGRLEEAATMFHDVIARQSRVRGDDHAATLSCRNNLAMVFLDQGKLEEAAALMEAVLEGKRRAGADRAELLVGMSNLASVKKKGGDLEGATVAFRSVVEGMLEVRAADDPSVVLARFNLARCLYDRRMYAEAEIEFAETCAVAASLPADNALRGVALREHGKCLYWLERYEEAERALLESESLLNAAFGREHSRTQEAIDALSKLYEKMGRPESANVWKARMIKGG